MAKKLTQAQVRAVIKNEKVCLHGLRSGVRGSSYGWRLVCRWAFRTVKLGRADKH